MFGLTRNKIKELPPIWSDNELAEMSVNYDSVVNYLLGLSDKDYDTLSKVVVIHRQANKDSAKVRGKEYEVTTYIDSPLETSPPVSIDKSGKSMLADDDELSLAFLGSEDDEQVTPKKKTSKKITVKSNGK